MARTWGQIRFEIAKSFPGVDLELVNGWIQSVYQSILDHRNWKGLEAEANITTVAVYEDGTIAVTLGSDAVTGTSTVWTAAMTGRRIRIASRNEWYTFTRTADTTGTLDRNYEGPTDTGLTYSIWQPVYSLASDFDYFVSEPRNITNPLPLKRQTKGELDDTAPHRPALGEPVQFAQEGLTSVELYPGPDAAATLPYRYRKTVTGFTGSNTTASPEAWVSEEAILAGVRAKALKHEKDYAGYGAERNEFSLLLAAMSEKESRRTGPKRLKVDSKYTRHRIFRYAR